MTVAVMGARKTKDWKMIGVISVLIVKTMMRNKIRSLKKSKVIVGTRRWEKDTNVTMEGTRQSQMKETKVTMEATQGRKPQMAMKALFFFLMKAVLFLIPIVNGRVGFLWKVHIILV